MNVGRNSLKIKFYFKISRVRLYSTYKLRNWYYIKFTIILFRQRIKTNYTNYAN